MAATNSPLRVLHVYSGNLYGGIETFLRALAEEREKRPEMQPEFALCFEGRIADELRASRAPLHMLGAVRLSRPWTVLRARRALTKVLRERRPDVVVCHAAWPYAIFSAVVRAAKTRLVFYRHDIAQKLEPINLLAGRLEPDLVIANSRYTAMHGEPRFDAPVEVLSYVLRSAESDGEKDRQRLRIELGAKPGDIVILQASRMQSWKGQHFLAEALGELPRDVPWRCWFVGGAQRESEKTYAASVKKIVERAGVGDRVSFLGQRTDVGKLMRAGDIFCQPNAAPEPFGIVFVEAAAAGLPIVTTDVAGGALEIVDLSFATTCPPQPAALAACLTKLLTDGELRQRHGRAASKHGISLTKTDEQLKALARVLRFEASELDLRESAE